MVEEEWIGSVEWSVERKGKNSVYGVSSLEIVLGIDDIILFFLRLPFSFQLSFYANLRFSL